MSGVAGFFADLEKYWQQALLVAAIAGALWKLFCTLILQKGRLDAVAQHTDDIKKLSAGLHGVKDSVDSIEEMQAAQNRVLNRQSQDISVLKEALAKMLLAMQRQSPNPDSEIVSAHALLRQSQYQPTLLPETVEKGKQG